MKLFVTGGAGFIGSNFVRHVLATHPDDEIVVYDLLTYAGDRRTLDDVIGDVGGTRCSFVQGDIADAGAVHGAMRGCDAVVNFAAETHVDRSILDADAFVRTNLQGVQVLLDTARALDVERFVHISTDETYGSIDAGSFREDDALEPNSPYAASKAGADLLVRAAYRTHGQPVIVTRSSNNYGPYQFPEKVLPLFITNLLDGLRVPLYGDGANVRDWCHVADNCAAVDLVLRRGEIGTIYNIGAGNELSNLELTTRLLAIMGADEDMIRHVPDRPGHDLRYSVDTSRITELGWRPAMTLDEGLVATVDWYRTNEAWWRPLKAAAADAALPTTAQRD